MTGLLAVMLAVGLALTYATLARSARIVAAERLERAADQLQSLAGASITRLRTRVSDAARDRAVQEALVAPPAGADGARAVLERLLGPADSGLAVELWSADGRRVAHAGRDLHAAGGVERWVREGGGAQQPTGPAGVGALPSSDSVLVGSLHLVGAVPHFWVVAPVRVGGVRRGFLARQYRINGGARAEETIRALTGADVSSYYRNVDGGLWTTISGEPASAPARDSSGREVVISRRGDGEVLTAEKPIAGAPFMLVLERPTRSVLVAPRGTVRQLAVLSAALLLVGALAALV
ncbi:MAG TPA: hypothetical protein VFY16_07500, partial [Gemmatimonadaceae bacterium]|nr:hypothetical protein [Gemmatimonadaceae bacterium]